MRSLGTPSRPVAEDFLARILGPYKDRCRYLQRASYALADPGAPRDIARPSPLIAAHGAFRIEESSYIADTGHLNAVDLNICYNQLAYLLLGLCIRERASPAVAHLTLDDYYARQLPDVLIHDIASSFKRSISPASFEGEVSILEALNTERFVYFKTGGRFWDEGGGLAKARMSLAILNPGT